MAEITSGGPLLPPRILELGHLWPSRSQPGRATILGQISLWSSRWEMIRCEIGGSKSTGYKTTEFSNEQAR